MLILIITSIVIASLLCAHLHLVCQGCACWKRHNGLAHYGKCLLSEASGVDGQTVKWAVTGIDCEGERGLRVFSKFPQICQFIFCSTCYSQVMWRDDLLLAAILLISLKSSLKFFVFLKVKKVSKVRTCFPKITIQIYMFDSIEHRTFPLGNSDYKLMDKDSVNFEVVPFFILFTYSEL